MNRGAEGPTVLDIEIMEAASFYKRVNIYAKLLHMHSKIVWEQQHLYLYKYPGIYSPIKQWKPNYSILKVTMQVLFNTYTHFIECSGKRQEPTYSVILLILLKMQMHLKIDCWNWLNLLQDEVSKIFHTLHHCLKIGYKTSLWLCVKDQIFSYIVVCVWNSSEYLV